MTAYRALKHGFLAFAFGFFPGLLVFFLLLPPTEISWFLGSLLRYAVVAYLVLPTYVSVVGIGFAIGCLVEKPQRSRAMRIFDRLTTLCALVIGVLSLSLFQPNLHTFSDRMLLLPIVAVVPGVALVVSLCQKKSFVEAVPRAFHATTFWIIFAAWVTVIPIFCAILVRAS